MSQSASHPSPNSFIAKPLSREAQLQQRVDERKAG
jgi:hypothetical protein